METIAAARHEVNLLADQLERAFRGGAWHGPAVAETLFGVDAALASLRPIPAAHTIWEIVGHVTAWTDISRRRIEGEPIDKVPDERDWPVPPAGEAATEDAWHKALRALEEAHRRLHLAVLTLDDGRMEDPVAGSDPTLRGLLLGLLQHQTYHAGQIAVLRKAGVSAQANGTGTGTGTGAGGES
jgi:uncharacterized damage-inducible protein DinB